MRAWIVAGLLLSGAAHAQTSPATTPVRPTGAPASEVSVPNTAPPAGTKQVTGSTSQDPKIKQMNAEEKAKLDKAGK